MLSILRVSNVAIIDSLEIELGPGLNVLTGETGAGKSIIVDSLGLLLGGKSTPEIIRAGADAGAVECEVEVSEADHDLRESLERCEVELDDGSRLTLRREIGERRSRAFVQGRGVPLSVLREIAAGAVNIHGQHEHQSLFDPAAHLRLLDGYAGHESLAAEIARLAAEGEAAEEDVRQIERRREEAVRRRDYLHFQVAEISAAGLTPGEEEALRHEKHLLLNAEKIRFAAASAAESLYAGEGSADERLVAAKKCVDELAKIDLAQEALARRIGDVCESVRELSRELETIAARVEADPARLETIEERLYLIEKLKKKYGGDVEAVRQCLARAEEELAALERLDVDSVAALDRLRSARAAYNATAERLSHGRTAAAERLAHALRKQLADLAMPSTRFDVRFATIEGEKFCATGRETAEFYLSANPGEPLRPLSLIASGGELSRIMLALKNSTAGDKTAATTLVFDEIDAGIGGGTAEVVGRKLAAVSREQQVLCVTHLPQIAAFADWHFSVTKAVRSGRTTTAVSRLDNDGRVREIARMMGSVEPTQVALRHAQEILRKASRGAA